MSNPIKNPLFVQNDSVQLGQMPGYGGYMSSINAENLFGKTFGDITRNVLQKNVQKGSKLEPDQIYKSLFTQSYQSQAKEKSQVQKQQFQVNILPVQTNLTYENILNQL